MKTPEEIMNDIRGVINDTPEGKKPKTQHLVELMKIVKVMSHNEVAAERSKLVSEVQKIHNLFPEYLKNFTDFNLKNEKDQEKEVKKIFLKKFGVRTLKNRIKRLDYLLD